MSRLQWSDRDYEIGVDRGVFYPRAGSAEVWNGLISVSENTSAVSERVRYYEGKKIANTRREDSFSATVSAFSHPSSFLLPPRAPFGMSYRVETAKGHKIHLVYNALAHISNRVYGQIDTVQPISFTITTVPTDIPEMASSAHLIVDTIITAPAALAQFEEILYGSEVGADARLPLPSEVFDIFEEHALYKIIDNGDGTFTIDAPDEAIEEIVPTLFEVEWPRITPVTSDKYRMRSW